MLYKLSCIIVLLTLSQSEKVSGSCSGFGLVRAAAKENSIQHGTYCIAYNPCFHQLPQLEEKAKHLSLKDVKSKLCKDPGEQISYQGAAVAVERGNCTFSEKACNVQNHQGEALLIVSNGISVPGANQTSDYQAINITVAMMDREDFLLMKNLGKDVSVWMYAPSPPTVDYNLIIIWLLAMFTVTVGGFWSGRLKHKQYVQRRKRTGSDVEAGRPDSDEDVEKEEEPESFNLSPKVVLIFVFIMCAMLVTLYFFYDYVVYVIIALFCVASCAALYTCSKPLLQYLPDSTKCVLPENNIPVLRKRPQVRKIVLALVCMGIVTWWAVERNKDYAWILQDILGIVFCIHLMKTVRLPSLKVCTILLVLLFLYDIFFVFITPLFTKSGKSVMIDVATGSSSSSGEQLPMVLKVPRFADSISNYCGLPYSLLGFGDILVPGLLIAFCHGFDLKIQSKRVYFVSSVIAYGIGLIITFVALAFMKTGQPALLYLVPCTLLTVVVIGLCRRELRHLWRGDRKEEVPHEAAQQKTSNTEQGYGATSTESQPAAVQPSDVSSTDSLTCNDSHLLIQGR